MFRKSLNVFLAAGFLLTAATSFAATTITFDDISTSPPFYEGSLPNGYQGLDWSYFLVQSHLPGASPTGYDAGLVSGPNDAFGFAGFPASFSSPTPFTFTSGYFTGAFNDGLNITIQGFNGATLLDSETIIVSSTAPTLEVFNWTDLTEVTFNSFGGTHNPAYPSAGNTAGTQFVVDNLVINGSSLPEPGEYSMIVVGLVGLIVLRKRTESGRLNSTK
jgi:hypothetical protein